MLDRLGSTERDTAYGVLVLAGAEELYASRARVWSSDGPGLEQLDGHALTAATSLLDAGFLSESGPPRSLPTEGGEPVAVVALHLTQRGRALLNLLEGS
ncbi:hypothetical protein Actkin_02107 [Actinokineospora sp. UTMC 2448]|nr:hypothetical protein Actkin_02107 [Actinokineospora sp. UTMC 2448]